MEEQPVALAITSLCVCVCVLFAWPTLWVMCGMCLFLNAQCVGFDED